MEGSPEKILIHMYRLVDQISRQGTNDRLRDTQEVPY